MLSDCAWASVRSAAAEGRHRWRFSQREPTEREAPGGMRGLLAGGPRCTLDRASRAATPPDAAPNRRRGASSFVRSLLIRFNPAMPLDPWMTSAAGPFVAIKPGGRYGAS